MSLIYTGQMQIRFFALLILVKLKQLESASLVRFYGEIRQQSNYKEMIHPEYSLVDNSTGLSKKLTPIYSTTKGLSQNMLRKLIKNHIEGAIQTEFIQKNYF